MIIDGNLNSKPECMATCLTSFVHTLQLLFNPEVLERLHATLASCLEYLAMQYEVYS